MIQETEVKEGLSLETEGQEDKTSTVETEENIEALENEGAKDKETEAAETEDDSSEEESPPSLEDVRKNIDSLDAQMKEDREELSFYQGKVGVIREDMMKGLPVIKDPDGKSIYEMSQEEFDTIVDITYAEASDPKEAAKVVSQAREARKTFQKRMEPYLKEAEGIRDKIIAHREKEWAMAEKELKALYPGVKDFDAELRDAAIKELETQPLLAERLNQGVVAKFKYLLNLLERTGVKEKLNAAERKTEQGNRGKTVASKGKSSSRSATRETTFTAKQINEMSLEEYAKHRDKIYAQTASNKNK